MTFSADKTRKTLTLVKILCDIHQFSDRSWKSEKNSYKIKKILDNSAMFIYSNCNILIVSLCPFFVDYNNLRKDVLSEIYCFSTLSWCGKNDKSKINSYRQSDICMQQVRRFIRNMHLSEYMQLNRLRRE